jgi:hypothetical protein
VLPTRLRVWLLGETALALAAAMGALAIYWRTLYPGLVATGDSAKFQFVGRILGTAHNPGYPLYVLLSHVFGYLPLGTPAYRMNLLAALCGAASVAFVALAARRLAVGRLTAITAAWSFGFGPVFWSQCTLAEVYALAAALLAAIAWTLLSWAESGRRRWLYAAVMLAALSVGHHLTIVTVVPALVAFVLLTRPREGLRPKFIALVALAVTLGLAQYGFVLLRTYQGAPYLGSAARNLTELCDVVRGRQFGDRLFIFDAATLLTTRVPLIGGILARELGLAGLALLLAGALALLRHRRAAATLLLGGAAGVVTFALNYGVPDIAVFLIPGFVLLWLVAGLGLQVLVTATRRLVPARLAVLVSLGALALPGYQLVRSFKANDHSDRTFEIRYFDALFASLPGRVAFVNESHSVDHMLLYKIHAEGGERGRAIYPTPPRAADVERRLAQGAVVFAFEHGRRALKREGFEFESVRLLDRSLPDYLREQPGGRLVALASGGSDGAAALPRFWRVLDLVPVEGTGAFAWIFPGGALNKGQCAAGGDKAEIALHKGETLGGLRSAADLQAVSQPQTGWVSLGGQKLAQVDTGIALAVVDEEGNVLDRQVVRAVDGWRAAFPERALPLWRVLPRPLRAKAP